MPLVAACSLRTRDSPAKSGSTLIDQERSTTSAPSVSPGSTAAARAAGTRRRERVARLDDGCGGVRRFQRRAVDGEHAANHVGVGLAEFE